jgi:predicted nucleic acid-binding protein
LSFDLSGTLRWIKPYKQQLLRRRADESLNWVEQAPRAGMPVLLDTTVYIDILQGRSPEALDRLIAVRACNHSAVCLAELTHLFGRLDPGDSRSAAALKAVTATIEDISAHRLSAPDADTWGAAGVLAGLLFRLGGYPAGSERRCLNDALVYLQARKLGCAVVTANISDFDFLQQIVADGRLLLYRKVPR